MKTCPVCAMELEDSYLFCPEDGSSLPSLLDHSGIDKTAAGFDQDNGLSSAVLLYCPTCGAEYPLTFTHCPVHYVRLTKNRISRQSEPEPVPQQSSRAEAVASQRDESDLDWPDTRTGESESDLERPVFRRAAIATIIGLALIGIIGLYGLISHASRRPARVTQVATHSETASAPFIETPKAAQDYSEEQPSHAPEVAQKRSESQPSHIASAGQKTDRRASSLPHHETPNKTPVRVTPKGPSASRKAEASSPLPYDSPHVGSAGFDSRLVRLQGRRTTLGYRYDLTFNMQERAGHWAQWQRVLITTRSASGISRSEAIPFAHRLGATGALTFTISVEMPGRSETDWRGRVACTTLGWDQSGGPVQAGFGANVSP